ncbi:unnamed protein product [Orchesella dallaii]|uniref:Vesicle-associated membrane protein 7 n=1 Tax=Orchesella dallaii TaxID=48710 RepID=A0ABP1PLI8_9HEXA
MSILFAAIAHGTSILAKYSVCVGNFIEVTEQVLASIPPDNPNMMTYSHMNYLFHYLEENNLFYFCITDDNFEKAKAFLFLSDIKDRFEETYGVTWIRVALPNNAMNYDFSPVLAAQMKRFSESWDLEEEEELQAQVEDVKGIMVENIENILSRGEELELLVKHSRESFQTSDSNISSLKSENSSRKIMCYVIPPLVAFAVAAQDKAEKAPASAVYNEGLKAEQAEGSILIPIFIGK